MNNFISRYKPPKLILNLFTDRDFWSLHFRFPNCPAIITLFFSLIQDLIMDYSLYSIIISI